MEKLKAILEDWQKNEHSDWRSEVGVTIAIARAKVAGIGATGERERKQTVMASEETAPKRITKEYLDSLGIASLPADHESYTRGPSVVTLNRRNKPLAQTAAQAVIQAVVEDAQAAVKGSGQPV